MKTIYMSSIETFKDYSNFTSLKDFNNQIEMFLSVHKKEFTKHEFVLFRRLTKYSAKVYGVSNASIRTILIAAKEKDGKSISETTFHRMKRKAMKLGILESKETKRVDESQSANLWIFQRFTGDSNDKDIPYKKEEMPEQLIHQGSEEKAKTPLETNHLIKTNMPLTSTDASEEINIPDELDHTYVPQDVNKSFIDTIRPFFHQAYDIYTLWQLTMTAYKESALTVPIRDLQETIKTAFKTAVFFKKQRKIKKSFKGYFYAVLKDHFNVVFRENLFQQDELYFDWR